jgi:hypothetical protein
MARNYFVFCAGNNFPAADKLEWLARSAFFGHGRPTALMKSNTQANLYRNRFSKGFRPRFADSPLLQPANLSQPKAEHCLVHRGRNRFNKDLEPLTQWGMGMIRSGSRSL